MRFVQFQNKNNSNTFLGIISENGESVQEIKAAQSNMVDFIKSNPNVEAVTKDAASSPALSINDVKLLSPVTAPEKILCIGLNYSGHCLEQNLQPPKEPMFFSKFNNTLVGPGENVILHKISDKIDWEIELAVVIGKTAKHVSKANALDYVFGYTIAQDISARDWQKQRNGGQFLIGKSMDSFCPLGPAIVHRNLVPDPHNLAVKCSVNGVLKQNGNSSELIYKIDDIIESLTQSITLQPGDVILTGTPSGVGMHRKPPEFLQPNDVIESEIENLGKLVNTAVAE